MTLLDIWLSGWLIVSALLILGAFAATDWSTKTKWWFSIKATVFGVILWPGFIAVVIYFVFIRPRRRRSS